MKEFVRVQASAEEHMSQLRIALEEAHQNLKVVTQKGIDMQKSHEATSNKLEMRQKEIEELQLSTSQLEETLQNSKNRISQLQVISYHFVVGPLLRAFNLPQT